MICRECKWEADAVTGRDQRRWPITHRDVVEANKIPMPNPELKIGHEGCTGCDCHHQPIPGREG